MEEILTIVKEETGLPIQDTNLRFVEKITNKFNEMLITDCGKLRSIFFTIIYYSWLYIILQKIYIYI